MSLTSKPPFHKTGVPPPPQPQTAGPPPVGPPPADAGQAAGSPAPTAPDMATSEHATVTGAHTQGTQALSKGVGPPPSGNVLHSRLALMTGQKEVAGTDAALKELKAALETGKVPTSLPLSALDQLPIPPGGLALQLDGGKLAGQRVVLRRMEHPEHGRGLEVQLKLRTTQDMKEVREALLAAGGEVGPKEAEAMTLQEDGRYLVEPDEKGFVYSAASSRGYRNTPAEATRLEEPGRFQVELLDETAMYATRGLMRLRFFGGKGGGELVSNAAAAVQQAGLGPLLESSGEEAREKLNMMRVLWQTDPKAAYDLAEANLDAIPRDELTVALEASGVDADRAAALEVKEVFPGHFTTLNVGQGEKYKDLGVEYLFSGVRTLEAASAILTSDGLMSTTERYARGMIVNGTSSVRDIATGGADYVFTRMVTKDAAGHAMSSAYGSGDYQLVMEPSLLDRTDWFAYPGDQYGTTENEAKFTARKYGEELVESLKGTGTGAQSFKRNNEVMFQRGISIADISRVFTRREDLKQQLIEELEQQGVSEIGGKPLAEAIQVRSKFLEEG